MKRKLWGENGLCSLMGYGALSGSSLVGGTLFFTAVIRNPLFYPYTYCVAWRLRGRLLVLFVSLAAGIRHARAM